MIEHEHMNANANNQQQTTHVNCSRFDPLPGDLVDLPVFDQTLKKTSWVTSCFEWSGIEHPGCLRIARTSLSGPILFDEVFDQKFSTHYEGKTGIGEQKKFTVFQCVDDPSSIVSEPASQDRYRVRLDVGTETHISSHRAYSKGQALAFAVVRWCLRNKIQSGYAAMIKNFQAGDPGYAYEVKRLQ